MRILQEKQYSKDIEEKGTLEILWNISGEIKYMEEASIVENAIGGDKEGMKRILETLHAWRLYNLEKAHFIDDSNDKVQTVMNDGKDYVLYVRKNFFVEVIKKMENISIW